MEDVFVRGHFLDKQRDCYALEIIKTGIKFLQHTKPKKPYNEPCRSMILYCLEKVGDVWMPLNREYKPIGLYGYDNWVTYEKFPFLGVSDQFIDFQQLNASCCQKGHMSTDEAYFIFNDTTFPRCKKTIDIYINKINKIFPFLKNEDGDE